MTRTTVIGLDGVPHWLLEELAAEGVMPATRELLGQGALRPLRAPVPDISSTSWVTFLTGADPGRHGVYGFIDLEPGGYGTFFPRLPDVRAPLLWEHVPGDCAILNVPGTYPAPPVRGTLISGFVAPDFDRAVHPPEERAPLRELDYRLDVDIDDPVGDPDGFMDEVEAALAARRAAFRRHLERRPRLAVCVITETDRVHHFHWRSLRTPGSPLHDRILRFYRRVDEAIAELAELAGDGALMIVSDHGFGPADAQFYLNAWLRREGYLALPADAPDLRGIDGATRAFALDPGRLYFNHRDRFPGGGDLDRPALKAELAARLAALRLGDGGAVTEGGPGRPLVGEVLDGAHLYAGPEAHRAPDLVVMPAHGVQVRGSWTQAEPIAPGPLTGTHTRHDATFWLRGDHGRGTVEMRDVAPTILACLGVPPGPAMEGVPVTGAPAGRGSGVPGGGSGVPGEPGVRARRTPVTP
ncbi:alkaline phosphatase family protein [Actinomadura viridis]|uniref:AlkP superfamily phosphohydrolase/phosphomutase n=1 Tax=Actinomadura viridis TaxID=58110 RepID=A0A931D954_9ACTN|nr:alkaline phosphatase family protein [Actinomadura viridis]MBG6085930.1 putative AlkP superfamily phosphohydrolase/phosphomutase [Actinomadura viridis]